MSIVNLQAAGLVILGLAAAYPIYPRYFRWREELQSVSLLTRQIFFVHCGFIVMLLLLQAALLLIAPQALTDASIASLALLIGLTIFWAYRLFAQLFIFDRRLWIGNRRHTIVHVAFTLIWGYLSGVFGWMLWQRLVG
ncbi:MAG: hypothetical protein WD069_00265 [Planctomycetales bacterium]